MTDTVEKIMVKEVLKIEVSDSLSIAKRILKRFDIRHLPVVKNDKLIGILSRTDVMRLSFGETFGDNEDEVDATLLDMLTIKDIMIHNPVTITPTASIEAVTKKLIEKGIHALPVVENDILLGIVTTTDILQFMLNKSSNKKIPKKHIEKRSWGNFEQFCENSLCSVKILNVLPHEELSLQFHEHRNKFWKVIKGVGTILINENEKKAVAGDEFIIPARTKHRIITNSYSLQILEISYGHFDEDDVVRLEDKYQRPEQIEKQKALA